MSLRPQAGWKSAGSGRSRTRVCTRVMRESARDAPNIPAILSGDNFRHAQHFRQPVFVDGDRAFRCHVARPPALAIDTAAASSRRTEWVGVAMVLVSATAFGTNAILAKFAYREGLGTSQTLAFRFVIAAIGMWGLALLLRQNPLRFERRRLLMLLALGGVFYFAQSLTYFTALRTLPASLVVLIAYIYPSLVVVAGWLFLRRSVSVWHMVALGASFLGVALLVGGAELQIAWPFVFAVAAPAIYTAYVLVGEDVVCSVPAVGAI